MNRKWTIHVVCAGFLLAVTLPALSQSGTVQAIRYGEIVSARETVIEDRPTGTGARSGATIGAIAGRSMSRRGDRWAGAVLGGVIGSGAGHAIEKSAKKKKGWELVIKLEDGDEVGIEIPSRKTGYRTGDRVRLMTGRDGRTDVRVVEAPKP